MKIDAITSPNIASDSLVKSQMGMSVKGADIAAYFLRDKIYSDKILAVVREYVCNAVDEHNKHCPDKTVEVKLESVDGEYVWSTRDFAKGLKEDDVRGIFGMYFESTKNTTNNSIGGFGVGSKAGHSYTDTFYVISHYEGKKTTYACVLGAGKGGIPIGEIYAVGEENTTESGIEVRVPVQSHDYSKFNFKSTHIISTFSPEVKIRYVNSVTSSTVVPSIPVRTWNKGDIKISQYTSFSDGGAYSETGSVKIRMGGVVYDNGKRFPNLKSHYFKNIIVVDVPIGALSIPISRESLENTPANTKMFDDIAKAIDELYDEDMSGLVAPSIKEMLVKGGFHSYFKTVDSDKYTKWFTFNSHKVFPSQYKACAYINESTNLATDYSAYANKLIVYTFPDINNQNSWFTRLGTVISGHYFYATETKQFEDIQNDPDVDWTGITFASVKKLGLPPLEKGQSRQEFMCYAVGESKRYGGKSYTPEGLEDRVATKLTTIKLEDKWWKNVTTLKDLNLRTISKVDGGYGCQYWTANSKKLISDMLKMGWLSPSSQEYIDTKKKICDILDEKDKINRVESDLKNAILYSTPTKNTLNALRSNPDRLNKLKDTFKKIEDEDSVRGKILRVLNSSIYYTSKEKMTRKDIRAILNIKN